MPLLSPSPTEGRLDVACEYADRELIKQVPGASYTATDGLGLDISATSLFVRGAHSAYITDPDIPLLAESYPKGCLHTLNDARHWPHIEAPQAFLDTIQRFFAEGCAPFTRLSEQTFLA